MTILLSTLNARYTHASLGLRYLLANMGPLQAQTRLQALVERSGILVFASHSNEFLARLCKTAMWIDHGAIRMAGGIQDVVRAYEGEDAARHVAEVLAETSQEGWAAQP